jgi:hypothetical protein
MSVFDLQNVADNAVGSQALHKVEASEAELFRSFAAVPFEEVLVKIQLESLAQLVSAVAVWYDFNDAAEQVLVPCPVAYAVIWTDIEVQVALLEDFLEELYDL